MFAYNIEKSNLGNIGFNKLSFFNSVDVRYSGFNLDENFLNMIEVFVMKVSDFCDPEQSAQLIISKLGEDYFVDLKFYDDEAVQSFFGQDPDLGQAFLKLFSS